MKKFLILTAVLSALCLTAASCVSCGRDNDDNKTNDSAAQGAVDSKDNNDRNDNISGAVTDGIGGAGPGLNPSPSQNR